MKRSKNRNDLVSDVFVGEYGDEYGEGHYYQDGEIASCKDVLLFCFSRSFLSWMALLGYFAFSVVLLYGYFFGITLLGTAAEVLGGCQIGSLLEQSTNPVTCVLIGVLATNICQSSTATNILISSLVGNVLTVQQCIFIAMGANVGNTVTNSMLVLAHSLNKSELERVAAGASVNDFFFFFAILVFLPLEAVSSVLYHLSATLVPQDLTNGYLWSGFSGNFIVPFVDKIIIANKVIPHLTFIFDTSPFHVPDSFITAHI